MKNALLKASLAIIMMITYVFALTTVTLASGTGMPWETPISRITDSITGPVAKAIGIVLVLTSCIGWYKTEHGEMLNSFFKLAICLSAAFSASTFILPLLGFSGGLGF
jgi:type IV secretory pathway VirB2 component (pilin)